MGVCIAKQVRTQPAYKIGVSVPIYVKEGAAIATVNMGRVYALDQGSRSLAVRKRTVSNMLMCIPVYNDVV